MLDTTKFRCPTCEAKYKVVRIEAPPTREELTCLSCGAWLRNREGRFALKYFRTDRTRREVRGRKPAQTRRI